MHAINDRRSHKKQATIVAIPWSIRLMYVPKRHHIDRRAEATAEAIEGPDDKVVRTPAAAAMLGMSVQWLESGRHFGWGPPFTRIGPRAIGYQLGDIREYLRERGTHRCTSEYTLRRRGKSGGRPSKVAA